MPMKNPPHPGKVVRVSCLEPLGLSVTEGAKALGVSRQALSNLVNGRARVSTEMAIRLAKAFGSTTETWIRLQTAYDIAQALERERMKSRSNATSRNRREANRRLFSRAGQPRPEQGGLLSPLRNRGLPRHEHDVIGFNAPPEMLGHGIPHEHVHAKRQVALL